MPSINNIFVYAHNLAKILVYINIFTILLVFVSNINVFFSFDNVHSQIEPSVGCAESKTIGFGANISVINDVFIAKELYKL